jgi:hypothetical protein
MVEFEVLGEYQRISFSIPQEHIDFLKSLKLRYEDENFHYAHAGFRPLVHPGDQEDHDLLWIGNEFLYSGELFGGKKVVHGHTVTKTHRPEIHPNRIAIDIGCGKNGHLACMCVDGYTLESRMEANMRFYTRIHDDLDILEKITEFTPMNPYERTGGWSF